MQDAFDGTLTTESCNLEITDVSITVNDAEFFLSGLPSFPIILEPGHIAGAGNLEIGFAPLELARSILGEVSVTYVTDPITGATTTETRMLCGEGVFTGARVLVTLGGEPPLEVSQIKLQRVGANRNRKRLDTVDVAKDLPLMTVVPDAPCITFHYHQEYGTVANPIQLLPGSYTVTATALDGKKRRTKQVGFDVSSCDFNPTVVVDLP